MIATLIGVFWVGALSSVPMLSSIISSTSSSLQRLVNSYTTDLRSHQRYCLPEITIRYRLPQIPPTVGGIWTLRTISALVGFDLEHHTFTHRFHFKHTSTPITPAPQGQPPTKPTSPGSTSTRSQAFRPCPSP